MGLIETYEVAQAASFRNRLIACIVKVAGTVFTEENTGSVVNQKRQTLVGQVLNGPEQVVQRFVWPVLSNPAIAEQGIATSDGDLEFQITQTWNMVAGVTPEDLAVPPEGPAEP